MLLKFFGLIDFVLCFICLKTLFSVARGSHNTYTFLRIAQNVSIVIIQLFHDNIFCFSLKMVFELSVNRAPFQTTFSSFLMVVSSKFSVFGLIRSPFFPCLLACNGVFVVSQVMRSSALSLRLIFNFILAKCKQG